MDSTPSAIETRSPLTRRSLVAALGGGVAAAMAGLLGRAAPVKAAAGDPVIIGDANTAGGTSTSLQTNAMAPSFKAINLGPGAALRGDATDGVAGKFITTNGPWAVEAEGDSYGIKGTGIQQGVYGEGYRAVVGKTTASGVSAGVWGRNDGAADAWGVLGEVSDNGAISGAPFGGCKAVVGSATAADGVTYGVWGQAASTSARAVYGYATADTGTTYAVVGRVDSPDGFGGYFYNKVYTTGWYEFQNISTPADPSATHARLYVVSTASGQELRIRFGNGVVKIIAAD